jgi:phosphoketolase
MALPHTTDTESSAAIIEAIDSLVYWWNHHHYVSGNDPGAPFTLQYVHPSQMDALKYWANAIVFNKTNASNLIIQGLVKRGTVNGSVATQVVNEMFGVKVN